MSTIPSARAAADRRLSKVARDAARAEAARLRVRLEDLAQILSAPAKPSRRELRERAAGQLSMLDDPAFYRGPRFTGERRRGQYTVGYMAAAVYQAAQDR